MTLRPVAPARTPLAVAAAALGLVALLAGCAGTGPTPGRPPAEIVREAVVSTAAAGPSHATVAGQTAVMGQAIPLNGSGVVDVLHQAADMTLQVPSLGAVRVVFSGGTLDAQLPPAAAGVIGAISGGKSWVSVDVNRLAQSGYGAPLGALGVGTTDNPAQQLGYLKAISDTTREVGPEQIDGVDTTHYAGAVDLDKVPGADDPSTKPAVDRLKAQLGSSLLPVDVWVDGGGKLRRVGQTVTVKPQPGAAAASPTTSTTTITFSDVGSAPAVVPPPADQVTDVSSLLPG
ncbi:hypothetical protein LQ327_02880 [Actinomycetospora endophytica]|uniref:LppX_LprAFG lipoprotein n=1 Tax=Actinomycetospora endophytica TaxID=2291215 RepID=A0ABS8P4M4_9PSEU|nr:hypothetical protein [Actinomycetospora endophytica]MCD2192341.1 hypothetical protein [Actinomycetospora endophytica]